MWTHPLVAQAPPAPLPAPTTATSDPIGFVQGLGYSLGPVLLNLVGAIAILLIGWIVASLVAAAVRGLLKRTDIDNRLSNWVTGQRSETEPNVEKWAAAIVFWVIMILAVVAALNALNLTTVSEPLNNFLNQIFAFLPKLGAAAILVGVAWVLATLVKAVVVRMARSFSLDEKVSGSSVAPEGNQFLLSETLGNVLYWFIFLFFLPLILGVLDLQGPLQPVQNLLNDILAALPRILKALLIGAVGWILARVVREIVTNLLAATGTDRFGAQFGLSPARGGQSLSWLLGTIVYVLILIPTAISALDALQIAAISQPATSMLNQILAAIPKIFTAAIVLVGAYAIGKFIADLVTNILTGIGFNNIFYWLGVQATPYNPPPVSPADLSSTVPPGGQPTTLQTTDGLPSRTPSEVVGIVVLVGILLFAAVAATQILDISSITAIVSGLLVIFGQILAGLVIFAIGLYLANLAFNLITSSGSAQSRLLGQTARISIIVLVAAMALQQMGIAPSIVNLAFGLLLGAVAVAIALAFGLGGRDVASEQLREWLHSFKQRRP